GAVGLAFAAVVGGAFAAEDYVLSPQMRRLRHSGSRPALKRSSVRWPASGGLGGLVDGLDGLEGQGDADGGDAAAVGVVLAVPDELGQSCNLFVEGLSILAWCHSRATMATWATTFYRARCAS